MIVGVLGSGQLGRMLALAGIPLGLSFRFYDESPGSPCSGLGELVVGSFDDDEALVRFASGCSVVTYEFENVPHHAAEAIRKVTPVYPPPHALQVSQDRVDEKTFFRSLGIATPDFAAASSLAELHAAVQKVGLPCVVKTRRFGYDGKGQGVLKNSEDIPRIWSELGGSPLIVEEMIQFERELSVIGARSTDGRTKIYPLIQNVHHNGILHRSTIPAPQITVGLADQAATIINSVLEQLSYVGVVAVELFQRRDRLLVNEMAPRVHNSGHATIDGCRTSQFENHIRAVTGLPLGEADPLGSSIMFNMIGDVPELNHLAAIPGAKIHMYGKSPRAGRKVGHVTVVDGTDSVVGELEQLIDRKRS